MATATAPEPETASSLFTYTAAAGALGVQRQTIADLMRRKELPHVAETPRAKVIDAETLGRLRDVLRPDREAEVEPVAAS